MVLDRQTKTTIIVVYGPNQGETIKIKEEFWSHLSDAIEDIRGRIITIGDLNGRVGKKDWHTGDAIGTQGENFRIVMAECY